MKLQATPAHTLFSNAWQELPLTNSAAILYQCRNKPPIMKRPAVKCVMKKPVAKTIIKKPTMKTSKKKLGASKTDPNMLVRVSPCTTCSLCKGILITRSDERPSECTIVGSESFDIAKTYRKECTYWKCRTTHRANFAYQDGAKINTLTFEQMKELGFYLVTKKFGFTFKYLELSFLRLLRGNLASGQEASVRAILAKNETKMISPKRFQPHLMRALEGYAVAQRNPNKVIPFNVDHPASFFKFSSNTLLFPSPARVTALCFDGHFGIHRRLHEEYEPPRTTALRGRPMKKYYQKDERTCTCANKEKERQQLKNRTAGWQFVLDPNSKRVVAAKEHIVNESTKEKANLLMDAMALPKVNPDLLIHDDACHFQKHIQGHKALKHAFRRVRYYLIDEFHRPNHKCQKRTLKKAEAKRLKNVRTNMAEVFNAWIRRKNFFLNSMNPHSHRFWVEESILFWNDHLNIMPKYSTRRSTAKSRKGKKGK